MALFGSKNNKDVKDSPKKKEVSKEIVKKETSAKTLVTGRHFEVIKNPRITEKATFISEKNNVYTFDVATNSNEREIKGAIKAIYNVEPIKVNVVNKKGQLVFQRGKLGKRPLSKKAYVYLKKGDKIEFA